MNLETEETEEIAIQKKEAEVVKKEVELVVVIVA